MPRTYAAGPLRTVAATCQMPRAALRSADIQRRAGLMEEAAATLSGLPPGHDGVTRIAAFERARIAVGDTGRHLISSALRPPARSPHVSHGKRAAPGFWGRLFGASKP